MKNKRNIVFQNSMNIENSVLEHDDISLTIPSLKPEAINFEEIMRNKLHLF